MSVSFDCSCFVDLLKFWSNRSEAWERLLFKRESFEGACLSKAWDPNVAQLNLRVLSASGNVVFFVPWSEKGCDFDFAVAHLLATPDQTIPINWWIPDRSLEWALFQNKRQNTQCQPKHFPARPCSSPFSKSSPLVCGTCWAVTGPSSYNVSPSHLLTPAFSTTDSTSSQLSKTKNGEEGEEKETRPHGKLKKQKKTEIHGGRGWEAVERKREICPCH